VEVIAILPPSMTPPAEGGILNIVLKKNKKQGYNGSLRAMWTAMEAWGPGQSECQGE